MNELVTEGEYHNPVVGGCDGMYGGDFCASSATLMCTIGCTGECHGIGLMELCYECYALASSIFQGGDGRCSQCHQEILISEPVDLRK